MIAFIRPPRLADPGGQLMQGDLFAEVPLLRPTADGGATIVAKPAVLLTPTCDFALKRGDLERLVALVEPVASDDRRRTAWRDGAMPRHVLLLPPLPELLPEGGLVHFRLTSLVHAEALERAERVATLDAAGLRRLLAALTTYTTRATVAPDQIPIGPADPRLLWERLDAARAIMGLAERRHTLQEALAVAVDALARHHGVAAPSPAAALVWLPLLAERNLLPASSGAAVAAVLEVERTIRALYRVLPADLAGRQAEFDRACALLEDLGAILQEPDPLQLTPARLRAAGLANLIR